MRPTPYSHGTLTLLPTPQAVFKRFTNASTTSVIVTTPNGPPVQIQSQISSSKIHTDTHTHTHTHTHTRARAREAGVPLLSVIQTRCTWHVPSSVVTSARVEVLLHVTGPVICRTQKERRQHTHSDTTHRNTYGNGNMTPANGPQEVAHWLQQRAEWLNQSPYIHDVWWRCDLVFAAITYIEVVALKLSTIFPSASTTAAAETRNRPMRRSARSAGSVSLT